MSSRALRIACLLSAATIWACSGDVGGSAFGSSSSGSSGSGAGSSSSSSGNSSGLGGGLSSSSSSGNGGAGSNDCGTDLTGMIRDFQVSHPDFEYVIQFDPGIVQEDIGPDDKPVYAGSPTTPTTHGKDAFDQWFRDVPGVNVPIPLTITIVDQGDGTYTYDNSAFFPIDGQGWGDEGNVHNYHFTFELHGVFLYDGGEVFSFTGDDDLFVFINGKLAMDLGGVHGAMNASVDLDAEASYLGISPGNVYPLDFFFAERHTSESNFRIDTTIACFVPPPPQ